MKWLWLLFFFTPHITTVEATKFNRDAQDAEDDSDDSSVTKAAAPAPVAASSQEDDSDDSSVTKAAAPAPAAASSQEEEDDDDADVNVVEATCDVFDCPSGYSRRNIKSTLLSTENCCQAETVAALRAGGAPAGVKGEAAPAPAAASEEDDDDDADLEIVEATCEVFDCPVGYSRKSSNSTVLSKDNCCKAGMDDVAVSALRVSGGVTPVMNFLIMAYKGMPHKAVWERFLKGAKSGVDYRVFIHCKYEHHCRQELKNHPDFTVVKGVKTEYCFGLVHAMNELLKAALLQRPSGSSLDKFVFASDTTIPVKPFSVMRQQLTSRDTSDFCFFPQHWLPWPKEKIAHSGLLTFLYDEFDSWNVSASSASRVALKHSQWMTLSRKDAEDAVKKDGLLPNLLDDLAVNTGWPGTTSGCTDEFWHFNALHSDLNAAKSKHAVVQLSGVTNGRFRNNARVLQGQCDTFVYWQDEDNDGAAGDVVNLGRQLEADAATHFTHKVRRPCEFTGFGAKSLAMLRDSPYLFMRKVMPSAKVTGSYQGKPLKSMSDAFEKLVYSDKPVKPEELQDSMLKVDQPIKKPKRHNWSVPNAYKAILNHGKRLARKTQPEEVTGDLTLVVAQPEEFADNPMSQSVMTKIVADLCGVSNWDVKVEITPSGRASTALTRYLRLNWGNVDASFTVTLSPSTAESAKERSRKVQDILTKADMTKLTKQIYEALLDQDQFDGSVKAMSISLSSFDSKEELNSVALLACHKFGFMC